MKNKRIEDIIDRLAEKGYFTMKDIINEAYKVGFEDPRLIQIYAEELLLEKMASGEVRKNGRILYKGVG